jgi:hypothetical protein
MAPDHEVGREAEGMCRGNSPSHVEEWRETEPVTDDTDLRDESVAGGAEGSAARTDEEP